LFEEGIVEDLDDMEGIICGTFTIQDYRGYLIYLEIEDFNNYPLSDEILRMKTTQFDFRKQSKPIHKLVSPEPHFVEEERNLIENHFSYLGESYYGEIDDIEDWECFEIDCEGHLVSFSHNFSNFQFSNESIEHLSNFPYLRNLYLPLHFSYFSKYEEEITKVENVTNFSLLSDLVKLEMSFEGEFEDPELFKDLGLFTNLISLDLCSNNGFENYKFNRFPFSTIFCILLGFIILPPSFSNLSNLVSLCLSDITLQSFEKNSFFQFSQSFLFDL